MVNIVRVVADDDGQTSFADVHLPPVANPGDGVGGAWLSLRDIPTTTLNINELLGPLGVVDFHVAPRRQMIVVLRGAFDVTTTRGETRRFECGDCLLAEDVEGTGHRFEDVGEEPLATLAIGIGGSWELS
jgi:mannose-6-phosphate isomerase-like protein (cupin superfamily)